MGSNAIVKATNIYGNYMPGGVFRNAANNHGVKGKFNYKPNNQKRDHEGVSKESTSTAIPTEQPRDSDGFQSVKPRRGVVLETQNGDEIYKDEMFDENSYTDACFKEFRNLNQGVMDDFINQQGKLVDKSKTGYIMIPHFQSGPRDEVIQNIYQSFTFAKVWDRVRRFDRHIRAGTDIVIQPTPSESLFLIHLAEPEHLQQLVGSQTVAFFKKDRFAKVEHEMKKAGDIRIYAFQKPNFTYIVQNAPITFPLNEEVCTKLYELFSRQMGPDYIIHVSPVRKQYQIRPLNGTVQETIDVLTGSYKVNIELKDGVSITDVKYPYEGKIFLNLSNGKHTVYTEKIGGSRRCRLCRGLNCERDRCVECCRSCYMPLTNDEDHSEVECLENIHNPAVQNKTRRLAQKTNDLLYYQKAKTIEMEKLRLNDPTTIEALKSERQGEIGDVRTSYSQIVKKNRNEGELMATLNRNENPVADSMLKMKVTQARGRQRGYEKRAQKTQDRDKRNSEMMKDKRYQESEQRLRKEMEEEEQRSKALAAAERAEAMKQAGGGAKKPHLGKQLNHQQQQQSSEGNNNDDNINMDVGDESNGATGGENNHQVEIDYNKIMSENVGKGGTTDWYDQPGSPNTEIWNAAITGAGAKSQRERGKVEELRQLPETPTTAGINQAGQKLPGPVGMAGSPQVTGNQDWQHPDFQHPTHGGNT